MAPDSRILLEQMGMEIPLIGFYDAPAAEAFRPLVQPPRGKYKCVFDYYINWLNGETLHLTADNFGCGGCGSWIFGVQTRTREEYLKFLVDGEGLKASYELMNEWLDTMQPYRREHEHIMIGPLRDEQYEYLKSVTFYVNPDQLGLLMLGAQYYSSPKDVTPVIAPFGSGCMELLPLFEDLEAAQAMIGATDIAMRQFLPPDILAFTVTKAMYERLCGLDEKSFLYKPFWKNLQKARKVNECKKDTKHKA